MGKKVIKLKESDIVKLVKQVISENKKQFFTDIEVKIGNQKYKTSCEWISVHCKTDQNYIQIKVKVNDYWSSPVPKTVEEIWTTTCKALSMNVVNDKYGIISPSLAKFTIGQCGCGGNQNGGDGNQGGGQDGGCTTIRCKVESEVSKCNKKKFNWKEVKDAFELEFPAGAPKGSSERNQQLWKEWKKGWRPKCGETPNPQTDQDQYAY